MRLRRSLLQTPAKSSCLHGLLFPNSRRRLTPSESTLPQLLIPRHFISFISNTYKKAGGGPLSGPQSFATRYSLHFTNLAHIPTPSTPIFSMVYAQLSSRPGWGVRLVGKPFVAVSEFLPLGTRPRATGHGLSGPQVPLRRNPQSARIADVIAWQHLGNISAPPGV